MVGSPLRNFGASFAPKSKRQSLDIERRDVTDSQNSPAASGMVRIYSSESRARHFGAVVREMARGLGRSRYVAYRLARKDIKTAYATAMLGVVWDLLDPLVLATIFYLLMKQRVINGGEMGMPASVFVVYGMMLYQTFCDALMQGLDVMGRSKNLLSHLKLPPEALILSVLYRAGFNSIFRLIVMLSFSLFPGAFSLIGFAKFLAAFPTIILAGVAVGIFLAPFNVIYSDVGRFVRLILVPLRYLSPVLYTFSATSPLGRAQSLNSIGMILDNLRLLATSNACHNLALTAGHCAGFLVIGLIGWFIFHLSIPILAERA